MCARFYVLPGSETEEILLEAENRGKLKLKTGELRPGDMAAVLCRSRSSGKTMAYPMHWGFQTDHGLIFNARSETCGEKPLFRNSFQNRRCLVPMSVYFEWDHRTKPMIKYGFRPEEKGLCCFAGLYRMEEDAFSFTILTRQPTPEISVFHDRMPVILSGDAAQDWLSGSEEQAKTAVSMSLTNLSYGAVA